jgi:hypothetical protein
MSLTSTDLHGDLYGHLQVGPVSFTGGSHVSYRCLPSYTHADECTPPQTLNPKP